jgi:hypothetical protein
MAECWLVDPANGLITVVDFTAATPDIRTIDRASGIRSAVLPAFTLPAALFLD